MSASYQHLIDHLPHGQGFRFVSEITDLNPGKSATGLWHLNGDEAFLQDHFPDQPVVPGVLITEALAQLCGIMGIDPEAANPNATAGIAHIDVRLLRPAIPDLNQSPSLTLTLHSELRTEVGPLIVCSVKATLEADGKTLTLARGELSLTRQLSN